MTERKRTAGKQKKYICAGCERPIVGTVWHDPTLGYEPGEVPFCGPCVGKPAVHRPSAYCRCGRPFPHVHTPSCEPEYGEAVPTGLRSR